jgi:hypothetical protein
MIKLDREALISFGRRSGRTVQQAAGAAMVKLDREALISFGRRSGRTVQAAGATMVKLDREALISFGVLGALLLVCLSVVGFSLHARFAAAHELVTQSELLSRLEARSRSDAAQRRLGVAPEAAFVSAPTQGLASAQLQAYLQRVIGTNHAVLVSSGTDPTKGDSIRLRATFDTNLRSLQALLYQLESGTPYVFVESINIDLPAADAQRPVEDPLLRITLALRAVWRRDAA